MPILNENAQILGKRFAFPELTKFSGPFSTLNLSKQGVLLLILAAVIVAQALGIIYNKQSQRNLQAKLQANYAERDRLHNEWSQLLLEQGTWQANARVEKIAREQLGMVFPTKTEIIVP
jgi:cell division protein FtsL